MKKTDFKTIDDYIGTFDEADQEVLENIRQTVRNVAPDAKEVISYKMPTFKLYGILVHFAAFENHYSLFPTPSAIEAFKDQLAAFETSKGTIKFSKDNPIPYDLITEIVSFRVKENLNRKSKYQTDL